MRLVFIWDMLGYDKTMGKKAFGTTPIKMGCIYELRDFVAQDGHGKPEHTMVIARSAEVGDDGYLRVGVAFMKPCSAATDSAGFALEPSCFVFPCDLRS